jgi:hypothetical protein
VPADDMSDRFEVAQFALKLIRSLLHNDGELDPKKSTNPSIKSQLRLNAGLCYLKMVRAAGYKSLIEARDWENLGKVIQDSVYNVRELFIDKIIKYLAGSFLPISHIILLVLVLMY